MNKDKEYILLDPDKLRAQKVKVIDQTYGRVYLELIHDEPTTKSVNEYVD